ncbi:hybrid sensor histidine kinase/response regulator transcription factor [Puia sp.]|uniref:hybrid sensor histidine kinase/response regulator transcription factor n=1 Tax=Puia sp. TaxID=2045100 RepID=UPI002F413656
MIALPNTALLIGVILLFYSCSSPNTEKKYRIGFAQCTGTENWKRATREAMARELSFHPGTELIYRSANDNSELQVRQIKELLNQNIDILLVSPNEAKPLTSVVEEAYNRGIPVVVIDRKTSSDLYTSFIGINNYELGKMAGEYVAHAVHDTANIIEAIGLQGSTPSADRQRGFEDRIRQSPMIHIKARVYGDWLQDKSTAAFLRIKDQLSPNDVVFAQNDPMALGAYEVYKSLGMERSARFFGIDGLSGPGGGIQLVSDQVLQATFLTPTGGEEAIKTAFAILEKQPFHKEYIMPTVVIDSTNVRVMKQQTDRINDQTHDIEKQYALLQEQRRIYHNQRNLLYIAITALGLTLILGGIAFFALRNNRRINRRLAGQNEKILTQRNQLIEMTARAKEATDAKFNFFTNISHEFRTPLTLILGPLEDSLASPKLHFTIKHNLQLVQKSAMRLMRLINQLMDFRKIEENKMRLIVSENNITDFVTEIAGSFHEIARRKAITFTIASEVRDLRMWFDVNILDKVFFNLLSNAFKFTNENGSISVTIARDGVQDRVIIVIQDSGVGMTPEEADHAFDLFYQGNKKAFKGTGLGLSLTKEMIHLHHGNISVASAKWQGSTFTVSLPIRREDLGETEIAPEKPLLQPSTEDISMYTADIQPMSISDEGVLPLRQKEHSLLVIEDNDDLRVFLKKRLGGEYELHEAEDAASGIAKAYDLVPDLIISDIILPGEDGLHVTEMLKQDLRTSHIPIVLLTAKGAIEDQIKGIKLLADAFIVKPFNLEYLEETIKCLLNNRTVLREHYTSELPVEVRPGTATLVTRKFINEFIAIVENNIPNEDFSVDDICRQIGISRVQLYRKVKALMGYNVNDYISTVRLQKAKFLLADMQYSISEVASRVGYSSQAYFSTVFKSKFSITPSEYREKKRGAK